MRVFCFIALFLAACAGCGEGGNDVIAEQDELKAYVAENPSPTTEELMAANSDDQD